MNIYDTFIYNNEDLILDIRLNYLNKFVEKFIIVEATKSQTIISFPTIDTPK